MIYLSILSYASIACAASLTISWKAPTKDNDGTSLSHLAGYKLYYGTSIGEYTSALLNNG